MNENVEEGQDSKEQSLPPLLSLVGLLPPLEKKNKDLNKKKRTLEKEKEKSSNLLWWGRCGMRRGRRSVGGSFWRNSRCKKEIIG